MAYQHVQNQIQIPSQDPESCLIWPLTLSLTFSTGTLIIPVPAMLPSFCKLHVPFHMKPLAIVPSTPGQLFSPESSYHASLFRYGSLKGLPLTKWSEGPTQTFLIISPCYNSLHSTNHNPIFHCMFMLWFSFTASSSSPILFPEHKFCECKGHVIPPAPRTVPGTYRVY